MCDCYSEYDVRDPRRDIKDLSSRVRDLEELYISDYQAEHSIHLKALLEKRIAQRIGEMVFDSVPGYAERNTFLSLWEIIELLLGAVDTLQQEVTVLKERLHG
jgi:hypothetical protein